MGGQPPPPPPPKPFPGGVKKARTMLKELKAAFKSKSALEAFASAPEEPQVTVPSNLLGKALNRRKQLSQRLADAVRVS